MGSESMGSESMGVDAPLPSTDPLQQAAGALESVAGLPLEQHPDAFARFDGLLREALDTPPQGSAG